MTLALVIPVLNHREETIACLKSFKENADNWQDIEVLIIDNGSTVPAREWGIEGLTEKNFLRFEENIGVLPAQQAGYEHTTADYIFYTHNDVTIYEHGWDTKIIQTLEGINAGHAKGVGIAGFFGSKGLGNGDLYKTPYQMHQLIRVENVSDCHRMPAAHGHRNIRGGDGWEQVTVLDGFSLIVSRRFLDENRVRTYEPLNQLMGAQVPKYSESGSGFDRNLPPHHMYDIHTCLQAIDRGYMNIVISMDAFHHGGVTDVSEDWSDKFGKTKSEIHQEAHYPYFYHYWMPDSPQAQHSINITLPYAI